MALRDLPWNNRSLISNERPSRHSGRANSTNRSRTQLNSCRTRFYSLHIDIGIEISLVLEELRVSMSQGRLHFFTLSLISLRIQKFRVSYEHSPRNGVKFITKLGMTATQGEIVSLSVSDAPTNPLIFSGFPRLFIFLSWGFPSVLRWSALWRENNEGGSWDGGMFKYFKEIFSLETFRR